MCEMKNPLHGNNDKVNTTEGFLGDTAVEDSSANAGAGDAGSIPGSGRSPGGGNGNPLQYSCLGQRSLAGYSPRGGKGSDTTEQLSTHGITEEKNLKA